MKLNRWLMLSALVFGGALAVACGSDDEDLGSGSTAGTGGSGGATGGTGGSAGEATGGTGGSGGQSGGGTGGSAGDAGSGGSAGEAGSAGQAGAGGGSAGAAGTAGTGGGSDAGVACDIQTGLTDCDECINTQCITECNTCVANAECMAIWTCIMTDCVDADGGTSQTCAMGCATSHLSGLGDFSAFFKGATDGCVVKKCSAVCPS